MALASYKPAAGEALAIIETTGPTTLPIGAIADGQFLKRVGATIVGAAGGGGGGIDGTMVLGRIPVGFDADTLQTYAGLTFDGTTLGVASGTLTAGVTGALFTATLATGAGVERGFKVLITPAAGTDTRIGSSFQLADSAVGGGRGDIAVEVRNFETSQGTNPINLSGDIGVWSLASGVTTGHNVGVLGQGGGGDASYGVIGDASTAKASALSVGVWGNAYNTGGSATNQGGYFSVMDGAGGFTPVSFATGSAALTAHAYNTGHPIFKGVSGVGGDIKFWLAANGRLQMADSGVAAVAPTHLLELVGNTASPTEQIRSTLARTDGGGPQVAIDVGFSDSFRIMLGHAGTAFAAPFSGLNFVRFDGAEMAFFDGTTEVMRLLGNTGIILASNSGIVMADVADNTAGLNLTVRAGNGGSASGSPAGDGGAYFDYAGQGGPGDGVIPGGAGGERNVKSGDGGPGSATGAAGASGSLVLRSGDAGTDNGGGGAGTGAVIVDSGVSTGAGTSGGVQIGTVNALEVLIGNSGNSISLYGVTPATQAAAIADASGGVVIDVEARAALNALLAANRGIGVIAT